MTKLEDEAKKAVSDVGSKAEESIKDVALRVETTAKRMAEDVERKAHDAVDRFETAVKRSSHVRELVIACMALIVVFGVVALMHGNHTHEHTHPAVKEAPAEAG